MLKMAMSGDGYSSYFVDTFTGCWFPLFDFVDGLVNDRPDGWEKVLEN